MDLLSHDENESIKGQNGEKVWIFSDVNEVKISHDEEMYINHGKGCVLVCCGIGGVWVCRGTGCVYIYCRLRKLHERVCRYPCHLHQVQERFSDTLS